MAWSAGGWVVWYVGGCFRACTLAGSGMLPGYHRMLVIDTDQITIQSWYIIYGKK